MPEVGQGHECWLFLALAPQLPTDSRARTSTRTVHRPTPTRPLTPAHSIGHHAYPPLSLPSPLSVSQSTSCRSRPRSFVLTKHEHGRRARYGLGVADQEQSDEADASTRERLISTQCRACGADIDYAGTGRRPFYCSAACRQRGWSLRQAGAQLDRGDPRPEVVREVVERTRDVERVVPIERPARPQLAVDWIPLLEQLDRQIRDDPASLMRGPDDFQHLAATVLRLYHAFTWNSSSSETTTSAPRLSRQQRRARERQRGKPQ